MKKVLFVCSLLSLLLAGSVGATLLNTTDQVLNSNYALGRNPAANIYNQNYSVEGGMTLFTNFSMNKSYLDNVAGYSGSNLEPKEQWLNTYVKYSNKLSGNRWWSIGFANDYDTMYSYKIKNQAAEDEKYGLYSKGGREVIRATYEMDLNGTMRGLYLGAELGINKDVVTDYVQQNSASKAANGGRSEEDLKDESDYYLSYGLGGVLEQGADSKFTFNHVIFNHKQSDKSGKDITNANVSIQYSEKLAPYTSLGYIRRLNPNWEVGGALNVFWPTNYTEVGNRWTTIDSGPQTEIEVAKRGYKTYSLLAEYKLENKYAAQSWMQGLVFQGNFGWTDNWVGQINTDRDDAFQDGHYQGTMGINVLKTMNEDTLIAGLQRSRVLWSTLGREIDETKFYFDWRKML